MVKPFTLTNSERLFALIESVKYVIHNNIQGDFVECGVWKGGSMMAVEKTLLKLKNQERKLYLFDTFEGMVKPTEEDLDFTGVSASTKFEKTKIDNKSSYWDRSELSEVKKAVLSIGYEKSKIHFIKGKVEDTIPNGAPESISLLRLDTDWYESTRHELVHLFPRLSRGGVIIIDDYGQWAGQKKAVDEYFAQNNIAILLNRIDYSARIGVKL